MQQEAKGTQKAAQLERFGRDGTEEAMIGSPEINQSADNSRIVEHAGPVVVVDKAEVENDREKEARAQLA